MNPPDLRALQAGEERAWEAAFDSLWPTAFAVAQLKLRAFFPENVEDVAIEALEEVVSKVRGLKSTEELKPLVASIAHNRAVSLLRERFARKRGAGKTESLDDHPNGAREPVDPPSEASLLVELDQVELAALWRDLQRAREPVIEIAMFDPAGPARGASTNEAAIVQELWPSAGLREFVDLRELHAWFGQGQGSARRLSVRIVYDRPAAEVRVAVRQGARVAETTIPVETDLRSALGKAREFAEAAFRVR